MSVPFDLFRRQLAKMYKAADLTYAAAQDTAYVKRSGETRYFLFHYFWWLFIKTTLLYSAIRFVGIFVFNGLRNRMVAWVVRWYLRRYFKLRGVTFYRTSPFPQKPTRPLVILTTKLHTFSALFAHQLFNFPVLVPLSAQFERYRMIPGLPSTFMGKAFRTMSYGEGSLNVAWPHLKALVAQGHSVIVQVNAVTHDPLFPMKTPIYEAVKQILADPDLGADLLFLNLDGFERYPKASLLSPIQVRCDLRPPEDVYPLDPNATLQDKLTAVAQFLAIPDYCIVRAE